MKTLILQDGNGNRVFINLESLKGFYFGFYGWSINFYSFKKVHDETVVQRIIVPGPEANLYSLDGTIKEGDREKWAKEKEELESLYPKVVELININLLGFLTGNRNTMLVTYAEVLELLDEVKMAEESEVAAKLKKVAKSLVKEDEITK